MMLATTFFCYAAKGTNIQINIFSTKNSFIKSIMHCPSTVSHLYSFNGADTFYECKIDTVVICKRVRCGLLKTANVQLLLYIGGEKNDKTKTCFICKTVEQKK